MTVSKVLIVDDSPVDLSNLKSIVADAGYLVITSQNGDQALQQAKAQHPDLIFMDVMMPGKDGFATCRELVTDNET